MQESLPLIKIIFKPEFDDKANAISIAVELVLNSTGTKSNDSIVTIFKNIGINSRTQCYSADQILVIDGHGQLELTAKDGGPGGQLRNYYAARDTNGDITLRFTALPHQVDASTPIGGRSELRRDQGGLQFMGISLIPLPWDGDMGGTAEHRLRITWDLSGSPSGTRAVSTFGEAPAVVEKVGHCTDLWRMFFSVGNTLQSYPPVSLSDGLSQSHESSYGFYWFGEAPSKITDIAPFCENLLEAFSSFFKDPASAENPYRIFVRRATPARGWGGSAGLRSFMMEYDERIGQYDEDDHFYLLAHEMVHNWPLMKGTPNSYEENDLTQWYNEGVADYYATVLPYKLLLKDKAGFVLRVNRQLSQYYTNPFRNISSREAQEGKMKTPFHLDLSYKKGCAYLCLINAQIHRASGGKRGVNDMVLTLFARQRSSGQNYLKDWLALLEEELGNSAINEWHDIREGGLVRLPSDAFGPDFEVYRDDQETLDFGFDMASASKHVIIGLRSGSRAAESGLQEGDEIVDTSLIQHCQRSADEMMKMVVRRNGEELRLAYLPRTREKVECWQIRERCYDAVPHLNGLT